MALSKRLALLGAQSALSIAKPGGHGSSYNLINRRQISNLPKFKSKTKGSQDVDDSIPEIENRKARSYILHAENRVSFEMFFSNVGRMETTQDLKMSILKSELETSQENNSILVKREIQKLRDGMKMMQMEQRNLELNYKMQDVSTTNPSSNTCLVVNTNGYTLHLGVV
ncbi:hypothetical protein ISN45_Aa03g035110 [Arabidopsis thaliana x Arabidopsis arenosa]|uniref:Uncharacterized protein n=1 Tax=Arabidopsis thaliana x Arabidopsis arenosa TaxID=1240361 RepID=A0A8T2B163_9BRAS|nr:hypothetical protein ISN45_Aa03g035110 [Arabidopsis thaliana x Arabidopsis arenosa]